MKLKRGAPLRRASCRRGGLRQALTSQRQQHPNREALAGGRVVGYGAAYGCGPLAHIGQATVGGAAGGGGAAGPIVAHGQAQGGTSQSQAHLHGGSPLGVLHSVVQRLFINQIQVLLGQGGQRGCCHTFSLKIKIQPGRPQQVVAVFAQLVEQVKVLPSVESLG